MEGKHRILEYYLNHVYLGDGNYGIGPASWYYFRKRPRDLTTSEAALLAVLLRNPGANPYTPKFRARHETRRRTLLEHMYQAGHLDTRAYAAALSGPKLVLVEEEGEEIYAPQSVGAAWRAIGPVLMRFGLGQTLQELRNDAPFPLHVTVSLHAELSRLFAQAAQDTTPALQSDDLRYAAVLLVDSRPLVLLGGSPDLANYAFDAARPVGSVSKLFFYDIVWQKGYLQPDDSVEDSDMPEERRRALGRPLYTPQNYDGRLHGRMPHRESLSRSLNKAAYRTCWGERTDKQRIAIAQSLVERYRFPWQRFGSRHSTLELRHFYQTFVATEPVVLGTWEATPWEVAGMLEQGFRGVSLSLEPMILTWNGKKRPHPGGTTARHPGLLHSLFVALQGAVKATAPRAFVPGSAWLVAAKTGTTNGGRDAWFAGFLVPAQAAHQRQIRPRITFVVWAGYDDNRQAELSGGSVHGPIFGRFLRDARVQAALHASVR